MYIDFASDWPAYVFMLGFLVFFIYVIVKGNAKEDPATVKIEESKKK